MKNQLYTYFDRLFLNKSFKVKWGIIKVLDSTNSKKSKKENSELRSTKAVRDKLKLTFNNFSYNDNWLLGTILNKKKYEYKLTEITYFNDNLVYILEFSPKKSSSKFKGKLYINEEDFAIIKFDFNMLKGKNKLDVNAKLIGMIQKQNNWNGSVVYHKIKDGKYSPKYLNESYNSYSYISITLKFIENSNKKNKLKYKINFLNESNLITTNEYLFLKNTKLTEAKYSEFTEIKEYDLEEIQKYNSSIWKKYNIIAPTQSIINYDSE